MARTPLGLVRVTQKADAGIGRNQADHCRKGNKAGVMPHQKEVDQGVHAISKHLTSGTLGAVA